MYIADMRFIPQNTVSQLCSAKSNIASAARKSDETNPKNQVLETLDENLKKSSWKLIRMGFSNEVCFRLGL